MRKISALQLNKFSQKGCSLYAISVLKAAENRNLEIEDHPLLLEFEDVFLEEVPGLPLK